MGSGSLGHILLGTGLGILAVSGLIVTVLFGQYHNKAFDKLSLYESKVEWPSINGLRSCCVAIAVLGCIAAVAAIAAIALSILLEGQTMVLIIVGAVSALFAFACIIAEGIYTKKCIDYAKESSYPYYKYKKDHQKAIDYITGAIEDLLEHGEKRLKAKYPTEEGEEEWKLSSTKEVLNHLGQTFYDKSPEDYDTIFTYTQLWCPNLDNCYNQITESSKIFTDDYVVLYKEGNLIYATSYLQIKEKRNRHPERKIAIAGLKFKPEDKKFVPKQKVCWPTNNKNLSTYEDVECKMIKLKEINYNASRYSNNNLCMNTVSIVPKQGKYYSKIDALDNNVKVEYEVSEFPAMYQKIYEDDFDEDNFDGYTDSEKSFNGMSGKKAAKLKQENEIDEYKKGDEDKVFLTRNKVTDLNSLISECENYYGKCSSEENSDGCQEYTIEGEYSHYDDYTFRICGDENWGQYYKPSEFKEEINDLLSTGDFENIGYKLSKVMEAIQKHYPDNNKGKVAPAYKKYLIKNEGKRVKELPKYTGFYQNLYTVALIHLIVQIFGIILWAVGRFIGLALGGGSDAKTQSEGEA